MNYEKGYVYKLMDQGGPTDTREPYFREAVDVATAKPIYDLTCKFMYQETEKLLSEQDYFFEHYNIDNDEA